MTAVHILLLDDPTRLPLDDVEKGLAELNVYLRTHCLHGHTFWALPEAQRRPLRSRVSQCTRVRPEHYDLVILGHNRGLGLAFGEALSPDLRPNTLVVDDASLPDDAVTEYDRLGFRHLGPRTGRRVPQWVEEHARLHMATTSQPSSCK